MNNSVMKCCICNNLKSGEFISINNKKYHLCCIGELQDRINKAIEILGNHRHYSTPTEEQNRENEDIVDNAYKILKGGE